MMQGHYIKYMNCKIGLELLTISDREVLKMDELYQQALKDPQTFLQNSTEYLLGQSQATLTQSSLNISKIVSIIIGRILTKFHQTLASMTKWRKVIRQILFSWQLPIEVKYCLEQAILCCMIDENKVVTLVIEQNMKQLLEMTTKLNPQDQVPNIKVLRYKDYEEYIIWISSSQNGSVLDDLVLFVLKVTTLNLHKAYKKQEYAYQIFLILKKFINLRNINELKCPTLTIKVFELIQNIISQINCLNIETYSKKKLLQMLANATQLSSLIHKSLSYLSIIHPGNNTPCPICISQQDKTSILNLRIEAFKIIKRIYQLNSYGVTLLIFFNSQGENQLIECLLGGLKCFINYGQTSKDTIPHIENYYLNQTLSCLMIDIYILYLKQYPNGTSTLFNHSQRLKFLLLFELLKYTNYEQYLFNHHGHKFIDLMIDFCQGGELPTFKSKTSKLLIFLNKINPQSSQHFIDVAKYYLQYNNDIYVKKLWSQLPDKLSITPISTSSCYLLLCLFWKQQPNQNDILFFRRIILKDCLVRMDNLAIAGALMFMERNLISVFSGVNESRMIIDLSLNSKTEALKTLGLKCVQKISQFADMHVPKYLTYISFNIFNSQKSQDPNIQLKWTILKTILKTHFNNNLTQYTKGFIVLMIHKTIATELYNNLTSNIFNYNSVYHCIQLCQKILLNIPLFKIDHYLSCLFIQIALFYPHLPHQSLKEEMLKVVSEILQIQYHNQGSISPKVALMLTPLLKSYEKTKQTRLLQIFEQYIEIYGKKAKPLQSKDLQPLFQILFKTAQDLNSQKYQKLLIYRSLILLNLMVINFGHEFSKQRLNSLYKFCKTSLALKYSFDINPHKKRCSFASKVFQQDRFMFRLMLLRLLSTAFSCSLLTSGCMYLQMIIDIKRYLFHPFEIEMLFKIIQNSFKTNHTIGGIQKYQSLLKILYHVHKDIIQEYYPQLGKKKDCKQIFCQSIYKIQDVRIELCRLYQLFRINKRIIYISLLQMIQPQIRNFFLSIEEEFRATPFYPQASPDYHQQQQKQILKLLPELHRLYHLNIFRQIKPTSKDRQFTITDLAIQFPQLQPPSDLLSYDLHKQI